MEEKHVCGNTWPETSVNFHPGVVVEGVRHAVVAGHVKIRQPSLS